MIKGPNPAKKKGLQDGHHTREKKQHEIETRESCIRDPTIVVAYNMKFRDIIWTAMVQTNKFNVKHMQYVCHMH